PCRSRWARQLRTQHHGCLSSSRRLRRPHSQGREARGFACDAIEQARTRHQRANGTHARSHPAPAAPRPRRRGDRMKRRKFITLIGGAAAWPLAARAQQQLPVIGILSSRSRATDALLIAVIRQGLNDTGFIEGRNVSIEYRWAEGNYGRLTALAAD